jgi:hypothetical protein
VVSSGQGAASWPAEDAGRVADGYRVGGVRSRNGFDEPRQPNVVRALCCQLPQYWLSFSCWDFFPMSVGVSNW